MMNQNYELSRVGEKPMVSMEQSWESSVIQLAQAGNLRAIAFWVNRYLVPQGICAQVLSEQPGHLLIRVVSHTKPDCDRLVQFIGSRLNSLNSQVIRSAQIRAHLVGTSELLWEKTIHITPIAPQVNPAVRSASQSNAAVPVGAAAFSANRPSSASPAPTFSNHSSSPIPVQSVLDFQFPGKPSTAHLPAAQPVAKPATAKPATAKSTTAKPRPIGVRKKKLKRQHSSFVARWSRLAVRQVIAMPDTIQQLTVQSKEWFTAQTLPIRALTLGGSAVAVFFMGCGVELLRQYAINPSLGRSASTASRFPLARSRSANVSTALEQVPVIHPTVQNPDDPAVTLIFSNSAALGRASKSQRNEAQLGGTRTPTDGISAYQEADLVMTSLDSPLTLPQILPSPMSASSRDLNQNSSRTFQSRLPMPEQTIAPDDRGFGRNGDSEPDEAASRSRLPQVTVQELLANGVNVVNVADNLPVQANTSGQVQTLDVLKQSDIHAVGSGSTPQEARRPQVFEVKGQRIGYLAYSEQSLSTTLASAADIVPPLSAQIAEDVQAIREQVDWIVVSFRWQRNLRAYPESWQMDLSRLAIDQGADLVVGYHPQVTQGAEIYNGRVIAYSLGSSIEEYVEEYSDEPMPDRDTVTLKVTLQDEDMGVEFLPVQLRQGQAALAEGEAGEKILEYFHQASSLFDQPLRSPVTLDSRVRFSLPTAPDSELPVDPFLSYPDGQ
jgi:hypothetical protein